MNEEAVLELSACFAALRLLVEVQYANVYRGQLSAFEQLIGDLVRLTRDAAIAAQPSDSETADEMKARIATHLLRFGDSVEARMRA